MEMRLRKRGKFGWEAPAIGEPKKSPLASGRLCTFLLLSLGGSRRRDCPPRLDRCSDWTFRSADTRIRRNLEHIPGGQR